MADITVTTLVDENNGTGNVSLREAIATAAPGDRIIFNASLVTGTPPNGTINLTNGELVIDKRPHHRGARHR